MSPAPAESWSFARIAALLAAVFAVVLGATLPFAASAAASNGSPLILCSAEGPRSLGGDPSEDPAANGAKCAACVVSAQAVLPQPPTPRRLAAPAPHPQAAPPSLAADRLPPARAPPRPPSTAPPIA